MLPSVNFLLLVAVAGPASCEAYEVVTLGWRRLALPATDGTLSLRSLSIVSMLLRHVQLPE